MLLTILRSRPTEPEGVRLMTLGRMLVDGQAAFFTEEPAMRDDALFVAGESALPLGSYAVSLPPSALYSRKTPLIASAQLVGAGGARLSIGMRIVPGHYAIEGVGAGIVVGKSRGTRGVHHTRLAYEELFELLHKTKFERTEAIELEILIDD